MGSGRSTNRTEIAADDPLIAYRHDAHKFTGTAHESAPNRLSDIPINDSVPLGADRDAAALSRPAREPTQTVPAHATAYRLSLIDGSTQFDPPTTSMPALSKDIRSLLETDDPVAAHRRWLTTDIASKFNESLYYPYTSLKYHVLLVAALLDLYREGHAFTDITLVVDPTEQVVPHRTVFRSDGFALRLDVECEDLPANPLGRRPWMSWGSVWSRLPIHPLDTDNSRTAMTLDANLRRIGAWSTALQYIEDYQRRWPP